MLTIITINKHSCTIHDYNETNPTAVAPTHLLLFNSNDIKASGSTQV